MPKWIRPKNDGVPRRAFFQAKVSSSFLRNRLANHLEAWKRIGASGKIIQWIRRGVRIPWKNGPPQPFHFGDSLSNISHEQQLFLNQERDRLFQIGAWEKGTSNRFVSRVFMVPKAKGWRLVVDLCHMNSFCKNFHMKMETLKTLRTSLKKNSYMFSLDIQDGFYAMGVNI